jgi:redox-sensitive bicupin YhaK (pirin superfamily)
MITQAQIYLAGQRGCTQLSWFRSFHTFHFGPYQDRSREPFGNLQVFNDDTLAPGKSLSMKLAENTEVILLPVVGAVEYKNSLGKTGMLEAGQIQVFSAGEGMYYELSNPYETELVNFIQIFIRNNTQPFAPQVQESDVDLQTRNQLFPLFAPGQKGMEVHQETGGFIGKYGGRQEGIYHLRNPDHGLFVFVIEGAFEVQNRLMEARDGLSLRNLETLEFEALSNDAIVLIIEVDMG